MNMSITHKGETYDLYSTTTTSISYCIQVREELARQIPGRPYLIAREDGQFFLFVRREPEYQVVMEGVL